MRYVVSQGHKVNIVGETTDLKKVTPLIRKHMNTRWKGRVKVRVTENGTAIASVGDPATVVTHYIIQKWGDNGN